MKQRPLASRLRSARILLREWRCAVLDSERNRVPGPDQGKVSGEAAHELARFDAAHKALTEAIKVVK